MAITVPGVDNIPNNTSFCNLLDPIACETIETGRGDETLPLARATRPNPILLGIELPESSGIDGARSIRDDPLARIIPAVAVTAFALRNDPEVLFAKGCDAYLSKPISVGGFIEVVQGYDG